MDKGAILDKCGALGEDRMLMAKILDRAQKSRERNLPVSTDFISPQQQVMAKEILRLAGWPQESFVPFGGYDGAERCVLLFLPDWLDAESAADQSPLRLLRCRFRPEDGLTHRDLLGSLMGLGIVREKTGDILVGSDSADLVVIDSVADFLLQNWTDAGRAHLQVSEIDGASIHVPAQRCEEIRDTVSALRLDAVCATGFRMARGKAAELIAAGRVQVNWKECTKGDKQLDQGDVVSARGLGKFKLDQVGGLTRKGRISIVVKRYL